MTGRVVLVGAALALAMDDGRCVTGAECERLDVEVDAGDGARF